MFKINYSIISLIIIAVIISICSISFLEYKKYQININKIENNINKNKEHISKCSLILDNLLKNIKINKSNKKNNEEELVVKELEEELVKELEEELEVKEEEGDDIELGESSNINELIQVDNHNLSIEDIIKEINNESMTPQSSISMQRTPTPRPPSPTPSSSSSSSSSNSDESIDSTINKKELFDSYMKKGVKELRNILISKNLNVSGNKTKLVNRIIEN